jgi:hypothetical protein
LIESPNPLWPQRRQRILKNLSAQSTFSEAFTQTVMSASLYSRNVANRPISSSNAETTAIQMKTERDAILERVLEKRQAVERMRTASQRRKEETICGMSEGTALVVTVIVGVVALVFAVIVVTWWYIDHLLHRSD